MVRAIGEGFRVLQANDVPVTPANHRLLSWLPEALLMPLMKRMMTSPSMATKVAHAEEGRREWQLIAKEFQTLIDSSGVATPSLAALRRHIDSGVDSALAS
jgi:hypothetical protein